MQVREITCYLHTSSLTLDSDTGKRLPYSEVPKQLGNDGTSYVPS